MKQSLLYILIKSSEPQKFALLCCLWYMHKRMYKTAYVHTWLQLLSVISLVIIMLAMHVIVRMFFV